MLDCTARKLLNYLKQDLVEEEGAEDAANPGVFLELLLHLVNDTVTILLGAWMSRGFSLREHLPKKKCFLSGIARMRGGRPLPELKNTIYIFIFDGRKRCTSCPKEGEG